MAGVEPDTGYAWVVLTSTVILTSFMAGHFTIYGVLYPDFIDYFRVSRAEAAVIGSLSSGFGGFTGIFLGPAVKRYGCRRVVIFGALLRSAGFAASSFVSSLTALYVLLGVLPGIGTGCTMIGCRLALLNSFNKRRSLAFGINASGSSIGLFAFPPLTRLLTNFYGWKGCLLVTSGILLNGVVCGALLRPAVQPKDHRSDENKETHERKSCKDQMKAFFNYTLFKDLRLLMYFVALPLVLSGHNTPFLFLPARAMDLGIGKEKAVFLLSLIGVTSGLSRPFFGLLGDRIAKHRPLLMALSAFMVAGLNIWSAFMYTFPWLAAISSLMGAVNSGYISLFIPVLGDIALPSQLADASGFTMFFSGVKDVVNYPFGGWLVDITGTYATPFLWFGSIQCLGGLLFVVLYLYNKRYPRQTETTDKAENTDDVTRTDEQINRKDNLVFTSTTSIASIV